MFSSSSQDQQPISLVRKIVHGFGLVHVSSGLVGTAMFVIGSIMFLPTREACKTARVWLFIVGSLLMFIGSLGQLLVTLIEPDSRLAVAHKRHVRRRSGGHVMSVDQWLPSRDLLRNWSWMLTKEERPHPRDPELCFWIGAGGLLLVAVCDFIAVLLDPTAGMAANTISNVAAGEYAFLQDAGLYVFAGAVAIIGYGLFLYGARDRRWVLGCSLLGVVALCVIVMGAYEAYSRPDPNTVEIHLWVLAVFALSFAGALFALRPGIAAMSREWASFTTTILVTWVVAGPFLFVMPTGWDGLYERALGLVMVAWLLVALARIRPRDHYGSVVSTGRASP